MLENVIFLPAYFICFFRNCRGFILLCLLKQLVRVSSLSVLHDHIFLKVSLKFPKLLNQSLYCFLSSFALLFVVVLVLLVVCLIFTSYACSPAFVTVILFGKSFVDIWITLKEHRSPKRNIQIHVKVLFGTFEYIDYVY